MHYDTKFLMIRSVLIITSLQIHVLRNSGLDYLTAIRIQYVLIITILHVIKLQCIHMTV